MLESIFNEKDLIAEEVQSIYIGGGDGSKTNPYSMDEYYTMLDSGTWNGGYLQDSEGISYGMPEMRFYDGGYYGGAAPYTEYTMTSFILSMGDSGWDQAAGYIFGKIPVLGDYASYMQQEINDIRVRLAAEASSQGYSGDDKVDFVMSREGPYTNKMSLVDSQSGKVIGSETINGFGF